MSLILPVNTAPTFAPEKSKSAPERLVAGDPSFKTWELDASRAGEVRTGIWEATPGTTISIKGESYEFCHILEGVVEITEDGGESHVFRAGDNFMMKPGFVGTWKTIETVRKIFVIVA
ncbi:MAG TPA: cupin domain-containing protein [Paenirhodobacter sp.]